MRIPVRLKPALTTLAVAGVMAFAAGPAAADPSEHPFAIEPGSFHFTPSNLQAGAHSDWVTTFNFDHENNRDQNTYNDVKTTIVNLPPGFVGSSVAVPTCTDAQLAGLSSRPECPPDSQVGQISLDLTYKAGEGASLLTYPVYSMESNTGVAATLGFHGTSITQILPVSVRPGDSGLTVTSPSILGFFGEIHNITFTTWGLPASPVHNAQRGAECYKHPGGNEVCERGGEEVHIPVKPFLSNPTSCAGPFTATMSSNSWEEQGSFSEAETEVPAMTGCERPPFFPSLEVAPTTRSAESPSGLNISLLVPQTYEDPETLASSNLKTTVLKLPVGYTINPSSGSGLGSCDPAQFAAETAFTLPGEGCPPESKIGAVEVETPLLSEKLPGSIYIATPYDNRPEFGSPEHPGGSLLALYIIVKDPERGLIVKLPAKIEPNPVTGQLVAVSENDPQVAFSRFTLKLRQGATSPLVSPPACGAYTATALFTPWSEPLAELPLNSTFEVEEGIGGGPCPAGGVPPFHPGLVAGTLNNSAGAYSPMDIHITRNDGEQEITRFTSILPPGLDGEALRRPVLPGRGRRSGQARQWRPGAGRTLLSRLKRNRPLARGSGCRPSPRLHRRQDLHGGPLQRRALLDRRDHQREGRPVRPRHRRRTRGIGDRPRNGCRDRRCQSLRSDPAHHQGDRDPRARHPRLHRPAPVHDQPDQLQPDELRRDRHRRRRRPRQPRGPGAGDGQQLIPDGELSEPGVQTELQGLDVGQDIAEQGGEPVCEALPTPRARWAPRRTSARSRWTCPSSCPRA